MNENTPPQHTAWYHRGLWATLIGVVVGLIAPSAAGLGPLIFSESVSPWTYGAIALGIVVFVSLVVPGIRKWWGETFRRLASVRLTTTGRVQTKINRALADRHTLAEVRRAFMQGRKSGQRIATEGLKAIKDDLAAAESLAADRKKRIEELELRAADARRLDRRRSAVKAQHAGSLRALEEERDEARDAATEARRALKDERNRITDLAVAVKRARAEGLADGEKRAEERAAQAARVPRPAPRWEIVSDPWKKGGWLLRNLVPRSIAREVRIESDEDMRITDAGHWADLSPTGTGPVEGNFTGRLTETGHREGVRFTITWFDETGRRRETSTYMQGNDVEAWG